jgi:hypothetical protein
MYIVLYICANSGKNVVLDHIGGCIVDLTSYTALINSISGSKHTQGNQLIIESKDYKSFWNPFDFVIERFFFGGNLLLNMHKVALI